MTTAVLSDYYEGPRTAPQNTYAPFFPPCRPCGRCPACGRGYDIPAYPWRTYYVGYPDSPPRIVNTHVA